MKSFFTEFKKFITRGNVVDMAVGVIVGSAFTAIVNGLSNNILKPIINWLIAIIFGKDSFAGIHTFLIKVEKTSDILDADGNVIGTELVPDLTQSIYIDWGAFISAVLNFLIIAFTLFCIVKIINKFREERNEFKEKIDKNTLDRSERKELRAAGVNIRDKNAVNEYYAEKKRREEVAAAEAQKEAEEKARLEREANPTVEDLLKKILEEIKK